jgi:hypothetical protein
MTGSVANVPPSRCKLKGSNPFGEVTEGLLQISGPLKRMDFCTSKPRSPYAYKIGTFTCRERLKMSDETRFTPDRLLIGSEQGVPRDPLNLGQSYRINKSREYYRLLEKPVWCLGICKSYGLVLKESPVVPGAYIRIGLCEDVSSILKDAPIEIITIC